MDKHSWKKAEGTKVTFNHGLNKGAVIDNETLTHIFKCSSQGGMRRSKTTNTLILVSKSDGPYADRWEDDKLFYTGMGQKGDQDLNFSQNKVLAESRTNGVELFLFEVKKPNEYIFQGQVELVGAPYQERQDDVDGVSRSVWLFPLELLPEGGQMMLDENLIENIKSRIEPLTREGRLPPQVELNEYYDTFRDKFGPEVLKRLDGKELLEKIHARNKKDSLVYWLEFTKLPSTFGSIKGGSAYKFGLYVDSSGKWMTGSPQKPVVISEQDAVKIAREQRDQFLRGCELLEKLPQDGSDSDYKVLQDQMDQFAPDINDTAWGHKYFSLIHNTKLDDYHNPDYQRYHLTKLLQVLPPEQGRYVFSGRFVAIAKLLSLPMNHLTTILNEMDGEPHRYWRIDTRAGDTGESYWSSMRDGDYVSIGWSELNDLSELLQDQRRKDLLKGLMKERFYPKDPATAGKKATEVLKFATTMAKDDIVVASDGSTVLGIGKAIGDYSYKPELPFAHCRAVEWLSKAEWKTKEREGLRTTVSEIKKPETLVEIERRILGPPPRDPHPIELSKDSFKELILAYSKAVKKVVDGELKFEYLDLESSERRIEELKQLFKKFLDDPTDANLRAFWNTNYFTLSIGGGTVGHLTSKNDVATIHGVLAELNRSDTYNEEWERLLGSHWPLWELWTKIKDEPIVTLSAWDGLNFFGCETPRPFYPGFLQNYQRFLRFYQRVIGKEGATTYRSENEINGLFSVIWAVQNKQTGDEVEALNDEDIRRVYDIISRIDTKGPGPGPGDPLEPLTGIPRQIQLVLERKSQVILYGPPGTGKTYWAMRTALALSSLSKFNADFDTLSDDQKNLIQKGDSTCGALVRICSFHPSYGYEEFLEGYRPHAKNDGLTFNLEDGMFKELCLDAVKHPENDFFLVIDEINRGDIPRIFGELLTILEKDKRGQEIVLPFSKERFSVQANVYIIGTMNTADRSIALLDTALRRRFGFIELMPNPNILGDVVVEGIALAPLLNALNNKILEYLGLTARDLQIGHSYLLKDGQPIQDFENLSRAIQEDIIPLLQEYCYENFTTLQKILGGALIDAKRQKINVELFDPSEKERLIEALSAIGAEKSTTSPAEDLDESEGAALSDEYEGE